MASTSKMYTVYLSDAQREFLAREAKDRDLHESNILRELIDGEMARRSHGGGQDA